MHCTKCGTSRPEGMSVCPNCGTVAQSFGETPKLQNYLVPSILVTLCCCLPAGIVGIVYAAQVNTKLAAGDVAGAQESARLARIWTWVGFGCGVVVAIFYGFLGSLGALRNWH